MNNDDIIFLKYMLLAFATAIIAFCLFCIFVSVYNFPGDARELWFYGLLLHVPVWLAALVFGNLVLKIKIARKITFLLEVLVTIILLAPVIVKEIEKQGDYLLLPFYAVDYLLCLSLLSLLRRRIIKS